MVTKDQILEACNAAFENNKADFSIFKVLVQYNDGLTFDYHQQEIFTVNGVRWFTDFENERIDLGEHQGFYVGE